MSRLLLGLAFLTPVLGLGACGPAGEMTEAERGQRLYIANCTGCHHRNPAMQGVIAPAVAGSSKRLVEAMISGTGFPEGHPKAGQRGSMPALVHLTGNVDELTAYLASIEDAAAPAS